MIVAHSTVTQENFVDHFLLIDGVLQCHPQVVIAERFNIQTHWEGVVQEPSLLEDIDVWSTL